MPGAHELRVGTSSRNIAQRLSRLAELGVVRASSSSVTGVPVSAPTDAGRCSTNPSDSSDFTPPSPAVSRRRERDPARFMPVPSAAAHDARETDEVNRSRSTHVNRTDAGRGFRHGHRSEQLHAGDIVEYGGARHVVAEIRRPCGAAWPIAVDRDGWANAPARNRYTSSVSRSPHCSQPDERDVIGPSQGRRPDVGDRTVTPIGRPSVATQHGPAGTSGPRRRHGVLGERDASGSGDWVVTPGRVISGLVVLVGGVVG